MYGIFTYIWLIFGVNVGKYSIHGAHGYGFLQRKRHPPLKNRLVLLGAGEKTPKALSSTQQFPGQRHILASCGGPSRYPLVI